MSNFLCISNYNNDVKWVNDYDNDYIIYDRSDNKEYVKDLKVIDSPNLGYNIYDILRFIIDNYNNLPEYTTFVKGNIFPRHVTREWFEEVKDSKKYTPIFQPELHKPIMPWARFSNCGYTLWEENNDSWYMRQKDNPNKYFNDFNVFMKWCFIDFEVPKYVRFAPGANYVLPKQIILKYPIGFYKKLKELISHHPLSSESHLIERSLHIIWYYDYTLDKEKFI